MQKSASRHTLLSVLIAVIMGGTGFIPARSQPFVVNFKVNVKNAKVSLLSFYGEKTTLLDSAVSSDKGEVFFAFGAKREPGIYRISLGRQQFLDFIYNRENISIEMDMSGGSGVPRALDSRENDVFYTFLQYDMNYHKKMNVLMITGSEYPEKDSYYKSSLKMYQNLFREREKRLEAAISDHEGTLVARILQLYREPELPWDLSEQQRREELKKHYFDHFTLTDSMLIRTNLLTSKAIDYLSLYAGPNMSPTEIEAQFIKGVDVILAQLEKTPVMYEFMLSYLVGGFEKYKMENVLVHLYEKYLSGDHCAGDVKQDELSRRLKAYEQLALGKTAPDISAKDIKGNPLTLTALNKDYYLLVFFASWCPHCHDLLAQLPELSDQIRQLNIDVITFTLDTSQVAWNEYLKKNNLPWINTFDGEGWNGSTVKAYNIYATPTMFLIDRQRKIVAKPITFNELKEELKRLAK